MTSAVQDSVKEERIGRILDAALDVFSEYTFQDATTGEIARRAHVSKRDIYLHFPQKHALLLSTVGRVMRTHDETLKQAIGQADAGTPLRKRLQWVGLKLVQEIFSTPMCVVNRLVASEGINHPMIGTLFFEAGTGFRSRLVAGVLAAYVTQKNATRGHAIDTAAEHFLALISYLPSAAAAAGLQARWDNGMCEKHVADAVDSFIRSHTALLSNLSLVDSTDAMGKTKPARAKKAV